MNENQLLVFFVAVLGLRVLFLCSLKFLDEINHSRRGIIILERLVGSVFDRTGRVWSVLCGIIIFHWNFYRFFFLRNCGYFFFLVLWRYYPRRGRKPIKRDWAKIGRRSRGGNLAMSRMWRTFWMSNEMMLAQGEFLLYFSTEIYSSHWPFWVFFLSIFRGPVYEKKDSELFLIDDVQPLVKTTSANSRTPVPGKSSGNSMSSFNLE